MPDLRVLTWNSGGEGAGRGAELTNRATQTNAAHYNAMVAGSVPVQIVATQEANAMAGGTIDAALAAAPFNHFNNPHVHRREHVPVGAGQPLRVGVSKAYHLAWMANHATLGLNLAAVAGSTLVDLDPAHDVGVANWIGNLPIGPVPQFALTQAMANMRRPVHQALTYGANTVHVFTWHLELRAHWLGANVYGNLVAQGLPEAMIGFQHSTYYTALMAGLGPNDLVVILGDLNATGPEMGSAHFFNTYVGIADNLTHILAFSPNGAMNLVEHHAWITPFQPHCIVTARINW